MRKILLFAVFAILSQYGLAQNRTVSGKVTTITDGSPIPGVNVLLKGTTTGTVTDSEGDYTLTIPAEGGTLTFTFIGLATEEVEIGARSIIDVQMSEDVEQLSEVVVTAFGVEREEKALGYAVSNISADEVSSAREPNIVNSLAGRVAGAQVTSNSGAVGSSSRIVLRGPSSITGNNQPLYVIDGIPISNRATGNSSSSGGVDFGNGSADINPDDVASITVLKGPNAAALYGSRASNGVILITTKSGKGKKGIGISINSSVTFEKPLKLPAFQNSYGQGGNDKYFEWIDGSAGDGGVDESWGPPLDVGLNFIQWTSNGEFAEPWVSKPNNIDEFFETGVTQTHNVAFTAASESGNLRFSYTFFDQKGTLPNTELDRNTFSLSGGQNLTERLRTDFSVNYYKKQSDNMPTVGYNGQNPIQQFIWSGRNVDFDALRNWQNSPLAQAGLGAGIAPVNWNTRYQNNPFWTAENVLNQLDRNRVIGNVKLTYDINDFLKIFVRSGIDYYNEDQTRIRAIGVETTTNGNGYFSKRNVISVESNTDFLLAYNKGISNEINLSLNLGGNVRYNEYKTLLGTAPELELPNVYNLSNIKSGVNLVSENYYEQKQVNSLYGSGQIGYKNYLFLDFTLRNDWSSTLPESNNSYFYPSVSLSGVISDMLMLDNELLSFLKLRASWAQVGNDTNPYQLVQVFDYFDPFGTVLSPTVDNSLLNPTLVPEITTSIEVGLDARFLNGRISTDLTLYNSKTEDQIIDVEVSAASGYDERVANAGVMINKGLELQLSGDVIKTEALTWTLGVNYSRNINEVESLAPGLDQVTLGGQWNVDIQARPGQTYGSIFGPAFLKSPDGQIIHENGLPVIDETYKVIGNVTPQWTGGLWSNLTYKGLSLAVLISGRYGGDVYSMTTTWGRYAGVLKETLVGRETGIVGYGVEDNGDGTYRKNAIVVSAEDYNKAAYSNSVAESSVFDGTYFKLSQIKIGYTLPNSIIENLPFNEVALSIIGRNLAFLYNTVPHIDPETSFNSDNAQGLEFGQIPTNRSLGFNISLKF